MDFPRYYQRQGKTIKVLSQSKYLEFSWISENGLVMACISEISETIDQLLRDEIGVKEISKRDFFYKMQQFDLINKKLQEHLNPLPHDTSIC